MSKVVWQPVEIPKWVLTIANNVYDIERKLERHGDPAGIARNVDRMKESLETYTLFYEDPMGQPFRETRTDLEATISGVGTSELVVVEVIKPIIRAGRPEASVVVQKGIVVVQSKAGGT
jgi:hypothetical protein